MDEIDEIEKFAYRYMTKEEIVIILQKDNNLFDDDESEASLAFKRGRLLRKSEFNDNVMKLSDQLSSPAMQIEMKLAENALLNDAKLR